MRDPPPAAIPCYSGEGKETKEVEKIAKVPHFESYYLWMKSNLFVPLSHISKAFPENRRIPFQDPQVSGDPPSLLFSAFLPAAKPTGQGTESVVLVVVVVVVVVVGVTTFISLP